MGNFLKLLSITLLLGLLFGTTSCSSDKGTDPPLPTKFEVNGATLIFDAPADTDVINVTAENVDWDATVEEDAKSWLSVASNKETGVITVSVTENKDAGEREGLITVTPNDKDYEAVEVKVKQNGTYSIIIEEDKLHFGYNEDEPQYITVRASAGISWSIRKDSQYTWLNVSKEGTDRVRVTVNQNQDITPLTGKFTITNDTDDIEDKEITVTQDGKPVLEVNETEFIFTLSNDQTEEVAVTAHNVDWNYRIEKMTGSWLTATKGANGDKLTLNIVEGNETGAPRKAEVVLYADGILESPVIYVTQRGKPLLEVDPETVTLAFDETTPRVVNVNANEVDWDINTTGKPDWLTIVPDFDENTITLTATDNTVGEYRSYTLIVFDKDGNLDSAELFIEQPREWSVISTQISGVREDPRMEYSRQRYQYSLGMGAPHDPSRPLKVNQEYTLMGDSNTPGEVMRFVLYADDDIGPNRLHPKMPEGTYTYGGGNMGFTASNLFIYTEGQSSPENRSGWTDGTVTVSYEGDEVIIIAEFINSNGNVWRSKYEGPLWLDEQSKDPLSMLTGQLEIESFDRAVAYWRGTTYQQMPNVGFNVWHLYLINGDVTITPGSGVNFDTYEGTGSFLRLAMLTSDNESAGFPMPSNAPVVNTGNYATNRVMGGTYRVVPMQGTISGMRGSWYVEREEGRLTNVFEAPLAGGSVMFMGNTNHATIIVSGDDGGWNVTKYNFPYEGAELSSITPEGNGIYLGGIYEGPIEVIF